MSPLLKKSDVARLLAVSPRTVERFVASNLLPHVRLGHRTLRFRHVDVERLLERLAVQVNAVKYE
ncbi:MAG: helix-turn-helix domain-containing protein [Candidatus Hydrogenedentes bacterium]|nr:helix-turn-helix domain-containing protein [Candidatus Hydrogenedentota bacterium]